MANEKRNRLSSHSLENEEQWISVSDLMSALMMIFLLIALFFMIKVSKEKDELRDVGVHREDLFKQNAELEKLTESLEQLVIGEQEKRLQLESYSRNLENKNKELENIADQYAELSRKEQNLSDASKFLKTVETMKLHPKDLPELVKQLERLKEVARNNEARTSSAITAAKQYQEKLGQYEASLVESDQKLLEQSKELYAVVQDNETLMDDFRSLESVAVDYRESLEEQAHQYAVQSEQLYAITQAHQALVDKYRGLESVAVVYEDVIQQLYNELNAEFQGDLKRWNAEIRQDLTFRFKEPTVLFDLGEATLKDHFKRILDEFVPRYLKVIGSDRYRNDISEIRIEGHTSSIWGSYDRNSIEAYFKNMELSQERSRNTLFYVMSLGSAKSYYEWLVDKLTANGLSSSKPVDKDGELLTVSNTPDDEDYDQSQRVEFRVKIDAESKITKILDLNNSS